MKAQIEVLSRQMNLLKEYSIARSGAAAKKNAESVAAAAESAESATPPPADAAAPPASPPKVRKTKPKPDAPNCELVGKSPADQVATLQRCVGAMDGRTAKPRSP
jgi:anti-sigma factor RsiW